MAGNSKTRKPYNPNKHRLHVPMTGARYDLALDLHLSVEAFIANPTAESSEHMARILMSMANAVSYNSKVQIRERTDPDGMAVRIGLEALEAVQLRAISMGRYGISADEIKALRASAGGMDEAMKRIPQNVMSHAIVDASHAVNKLAA